MKMKSVLRWVTCLSLAGVLLAGTALADDNFEFHGYGRSGIVTNASLNVAGSGSNSVGRLGMENASPYAEAELVKTFKEETGEWAKWHMMFAQGTDSKNDWQGDVAVRQAFVEMGGLQEIFKDKTVWAGKRFYGRDDIHTTDSYWRDFSGTGAGIQGLMDGKLDIAVIGRNSDNLTDTTTTTTITFVDDVEVKTDVVTGASVQPLTFDARYKMGSLELEGALTVATGNDDNGDAPAVGFQCAAVKGLTGFFGSEGGWSKVAVQFAKAAEIGRANIASDEDQMNVRVVAFGAKAFGKWEVMPSLEINFEDDGNDTGTSVSAVVRPQLKVNKNFSMVYEAGLYMQNGDSYGDAEGMRYKLTVAPTIALNDGFWTRPQIRTFVTYIGQDEDLGNLSADGKDESELRIGTQVEVWF